MSPDRELCVSLFIAAVILIALIFVVHRGLLVVYKEGQLTQAKKRACTLLSSKHPESKDLIKVVCGKKERGDEEPR